MEPYSVTPSDTTVVETACGDSTASSAITKCEQLEVKTKPEVCCPSSNGGGSCSSAKEDDNDNVEETTNNALNSALRKNDLQKLKELFSDVSVKDSFHPEPS